MMTILKNIGWALAGLAALGVVLFGLLSTLSGPTQLELPLNAVVFTSVNDLFTSTNPITPASGDKALSISRAQADLSQDQINSLSQGNVVWKVQFISTATPSLVVYQDYWFVAGGNYSPYTVATNNQPTVLPKKTISGKSLEETLDNLLFPGWGFFLLCVPFALAISTPVAYIYGRIRNRQITVNCPNLVFKGIRITGTSARMRIGWVIIPADDAALRNSGITDERVRDVITEPTQSASFKAFSRHGVEEIAEVLSTEEERDAFIKEITPAANSIGVRITEVSVISVELPDELKNALLASEVYKNDAEAIKILMLTGLTANQAATYMARNRLAGQAGGNRNGLPVTLVANPKGDFAGDESLESEE